MEVVVKMVHGGPSFRKGSGVTGGVTGKEWGHRWSREKGVLRSRGEGTGAAVRTPAKSRNSGGAAVYVFERKPMTKSISTDVYLF